MFYIRQMMMIPLIIASRLVLVDMISLQQERQPSELCGEECTILASPFVRAPVFDQCPSGYECTSSECGDTCQKITVPDGCSYCTDLGCYRDQCDIDGAGCPICKGVGRRQDRDTYKPCVEECTSSLVLNAVGLGSCPYGYYCVHNGCGHVCQKVSVTTKDRTTTVRRFNGQF